MNDGSKTTGKKPKRVNGAQKYRKKKKEGNMTPRGEKRPLDTKGGEPISVDRPINPTVARSIQYPPVPDRDCCRPILNRPRVD